MFKEVTEVYLENTDRQEGMAFDLFLQPAIHITNLLPIDVLCAIDVRQRWTGEEKDLRLSI